MSKIVRSMPVLHEQFRLRLLPRGAPLGDLDNPNSIKAAEALRLKRLSGLGSELGLSPDVLDLLEIGLNRYAFTFPERAADGRIIGFLLRRPKTGRRHALEGSTRGLTIPHGTTPWILQVITEGATDCAASLSLGYPSIAVPFAGHCIDSATAFANPLAATVPCVIAHRDDAGQRSGDLLVSALLARGVACRQITPPEPHNDLRDWLRGGLCSRQLQEHIEAASVRFPPDQIPGFSLMPNDRLRRGLAAVVGLKALGMLNLIASFVGKGETCPTRARLAELGGASEPEVDRLKAKLRRLGYLDWTKGHKGIANSYHVFAGPVLGAKGLHAGARPRLGYLVSKTEGATKHG